MPRPRVVVFCIALFSPAELNSANTSVHTTWLCHLHQPIYWPDRAPNNHPFDHYQNAWDTIQLGNVHPSDTSLTTVFGEADRVNAYQGGLISFQPRGYSIYENALIF